MTTTAGQIFFDYHFRFQDGKEIACRVDINPDTLGALGAPSQNPPAWASFEKKRCDNCTAEKGACCPVAARLGDVLDRFRDVASISRVHTTVTCPDRTYSKESDAQTALGSLIGLIMATSESEAMRRLRPMARFHLPFSTMEETVYRFASMLLLEQHCTRGVKPAAGVNPQTVMEFYQPIVVINECMVHRLRGAVKSDATLNAVVMLNCLTDLMPHFFEEGLEDLRAMFAMNPRN